MKRDSYDSVKKHIARHGGSVKTALKATKINPGTYYRQKKLVEESSPSPTYELATLDPEVGARGIFPAKSTIVALVGAPEAIAEALARLGGSK